MKLQGKLYDTEGKEIIVPDGHSVVFGKDSFCFVPVNGYSMELVYRPERLNPEDPKYKKALEVCDSLNSIEI